MIANLVRTVATLFSASASVQCRCTGMSVCVGTCRGVAGHVSILVARRLLLSWVGCLLHSLPCATSILLCTIVCAAAGGGPILVFNLKL